MTTASRLATSSRLATANNYGTVFSCKAAANDYGVVSTAGKAAATNDYGGISSFHAAGSNTIAPRGHEAQSTDGMYSVFRFGNGSQSESCFLHTESQVVLLTVSLCLTHPSVGVDVGTDVALAPQAYR